MATFSKLGTAAGTHPSYTIDPTTYGDVNAVIQTDTFNLTTEPMKLRITGMPVHGGVDGECGLIIEVNAGTPTGSGGAANRVWFQLYQPPSPATTFEADYTISSVDSKVYNLPLAEYVQLSVSGTNLVWSTSANGTSWTSRRTVPLSSLPTLTSAKLAVYTYGSNASGTYGFTVISPEVSAPATPPAAPTVTAVRSTLDPTVLTATWTQGSQGSSSVIDQEVKLDGVVVGTTDATTNTFTVTGASFSSHIFSVRVRNTTGYSTAGTAATIPVYTPPTVGLQPLGLAVDDFNDTSLDGQWIASSGVVQTGGVVQFPTAVTTPVEIYRRGDATGAEVFFKLRPSSLANVTAEFFLRQTGARTQKIRIYVRDGVIYAANEQGAADTLQSARPYNAVSDLYVKISNGSDGLTKLYTSPNGNPGTWTELGRSGFTSPNWLADVEVGARQFLGTTPTSPVVVPLAPASVTATNVTTTTARINWTPPSNASMAGMGQTGTGYQVSWGTYVSGLIPSTTRYVDLIGLPVNTATPVSVVAIGNQGAGVAGTVTVTTPASNPSTANPTLLGLPTRVLAMYTTAWSSGGINTNVPPSAIDLQYLFHAEPLSTGAFSWNYAIPQNMSTARSRGCRLILTVGGANAGFGFTTSGQVTAFVNSVIAINTQFGGTQANPAIDGIDFNTYEGGITPDLTLYRSIVTQLRTYFGSNFIVSTPPAPWNQVDKTFCAGMISSGHMSYAAPQYYDGPGLADPTYIVNSITDWVANVAGGDASKIAVGFGTAPGQANYSTPAQIVSAWNQIEARFPTIRGAFIWDRSGDQAQSWAATNALAPLVL